VRNNGENGNLDDERLMDEKGPAARRLASDERLARSVAVGDTRAFAALYERYQQPLYRYCRSILPAEADAQDAVQSSFTRALDALSRGQRDAPLRPWLFRIAHNEAISVHRRRSAGEKATNKLTRHAVLAVDRTVEREQLRSLLADLDELPERQRGALLLRELIGLSHDEMATALGTSASAAKHAIFEARTALVEFEEGRATACGQIRHQISNGDRRVLRGRRIRAHLRDCTDCAAFAASIGNGRKKLRALLPPAAAVGALTRLLHAQVRHGGGKFASLSVGVKAAGTAAVIGAAAAGTAGVFVAVDNRPPVMPAKQVVLDSDRSMPAANAASTTGRRSVDPRLLAMAAPSLRNLLTQSLGPSAAAGGAFSGASAPSSRHPGSAGRVEGAGNAPMAISGTPTAQGQTPSGQSMPDAQGQTPSDQATAGTQAQTPSPQSPPPGTGGGSSSSGGSGWHPGPPADRPAVSQGGGQGASHAGGNGVPGAGSRGNGQGAAQGPPDPLEVGGGSRVPGGGQGAARHGATGPPDLSGPPSRVIKHAS
jgi:RNA polymerase sigma factor (sigma-70 family)